MTDSDRLAIGGLNFQPIGAAARASGPAAGIQAEETPRSPPGAEPLPREHGPPASGQSAPAATLARRVPLGVDVAPVLRRAEAAPRGDREYRGCQRHHSKQERSTEETHHA